MAPLHRPSNLSHLITGSSAQQQLTEYPARPYPPRDRYLSTPSKMRTCKILYCLAVLLLCQVAQCAATCISCLHETGAPFSQLQQLEAVEQHQRRDHDSFSFDPSQPRGSKSSSSIMDSPQSRAAEGSSATTGESSSNEVDTSRNTDDKPPSTIRSSSIITTSRTSTTASSTAQTTITPKENTSSLKSMISISSATASASSSSERKPFHMSAGGIAAAVVIGCFLCGGAAIMLYYWTRSCLAWRRGHQRSSLTTDSEHGPRPKSLGESLISSTMSARESIMFHPDHRQSGSAASVNRTVPHQNMKEQEPPSDHRMACMDIAMSDIEPSEESTRSPVSPLLPPTYPRAVSSNSGKSERQSLRREFSFENTHEELHVPPAESRLSRRSALSSHPPSDWPLAMPNYYSRRFRDQSNLGYQLAPSEHRSSGGRHVVVERNSFENI